MDSYKGSVANSLHSSAAYAVVAFSALVFPSSPLNFSHHHRSIASIITACQGHISACFGNTNYSHSNFVSIPSSFVPPDNTA